jgi:predicted O-methyltransferase YrrM
MPSARRVLSGLVRRLPGARALWRRMRPPRQGLGPAAPPLARVTHVEEGNQWYHPPLAGPSTFVTDVSSAKAVRGMLDVLGRLSSDSYLEFLSRYGRRGLEEFGESWIYADINTVLYGLAEGLGADSYLEIGVRRGRSMAMVAAQRPRCHLVGFDLWKENYAGMSNPGPRLVRAELERIGHAGPLELISGDSRVTVPEYLREHPDRFFDLVTVDGDHSAQGARADILNVLPRIKCGGALVFDDIANPAHPDLMDVWTRLVARNKGFASWSFAETGFGVAFAIKRY